MLRMFFLVSVGPVLITVLSSPVKSDSLDGGAITPPPETPPKVWCSPAPYEGKVTAITSKSITIQRPGENPKRFTLNDLLAAGKDPRGHGSNLCADHCYQAVDVRVGDKVEIGYGRVDSMYICNNICILRRPGGQVPVAPGESADDESAWHNRMNALQDWEEKRIPLPNKYAHLFNHYYFGGAVVGVGKQFITIQHPGLVPKKFELTAALAGGYYPIDPCQPGTWNPPSVSYHYFYRLKDVQIGDRVIVHFGRFNGVDICDAIAITRRPGGRVPPAAGEERERPVHRHSEWMNALQDWEEKGIRPPKMYETDPLGIPGMPAEIIPRAERGGKPPVDVLTVPAIIPLAVD